MTPNIDPDTTPDTYIEHRELVRIGDAGTTDAAAPTRIRDRLEHRRSRWRRDVNDVARRRPAADEPTAS